MKAGRAEMDEKDDMAVYSKYLPKAMDENDLDFAISVFV